MLSRYLSRSCNPLNPITNSIYISFIEHEHCSLMNVDKEYSSSLNGSLEAYLYIKFTFRQQNANKMHQLLQSCFASWGHCRYLETGSISVILYQLIPGVWNIWCLLVFLDDAITGAARILKCLSVVSKWLGNVRTNW